MDIKIENPNLVDVEDVPKGNVFLFNGTYYIRCTLGDVTHGLNLKTFRVEQFFHCQVQIVTHATLIIKA